MLKKIEQHDFYQRLGETIRSIREEKKLKQETVATHLGFTRISLSNIETGKQKIQLHTLLELADYFKVSVLDLVPSLDSIKREPSSKLEKKISKTEVFNDEKTMERIKDFIRISTSNPK